MAAAAPRTAATGALWRIWGPWATICSTAGESRRHGSACTKATSPADADTDADADADADAGPPGPGTEHLRYGVSDTLTAVWRCGQARRRAPHSACSGCRPEGKRLRHDGCDTTAAGPLGYPPAGAGTPAQFFVYLSDSATGWRRAAVKHARGRQLSAGWRRLPFLGCTRESSLARHTKSITCALGSSGS